MTIKERSREFATKHFGHNDCAKESADCGYMAGAFDQKKIMIDKFKQWLGDNYKITSDENNRDMLAKLLDSLKED